MSLVRWLRSVHMLREYAMSITILSFLGYQQSRGPKMSTFFWHLLSVIERTHFPFLVDDEADSDL